MTTEVIPPTRLQATLRLLKEFSSPQNDVLEVGSTDASFREALPHATWTTIDKFGEPDLVADLDGAATKIPCADESFDLVICTEVLEHLREGSRLVEEMARVLRPTGMAVISVPNIASAKARLRWALGIVPELAASGDCGPPLGGASGFLDDGRWVAGHVVDFNERRLTDYLARGGLCVKKRGKLGLPLGRFAPADFALPAKLVPRRLADYLLVAAQPCRPSGGVGSGNPQSPASRP